VLRQRYETNKFARSTQDAVLTYYAESDAFGKMPDYIKQYGITKKFIKKVFLKKGNDKKTYFDFNGVKLPGILRSSRGMDAVLPAFMDTLLFLCLFNDNYDKKIVDKIEIGMMEGPYSYKDENVDVTVKSGDVVLDAGACLGDFSAYAALKGAKAYAFEPDDKVYNYLSAAAVLNDNKFIPVKKGLSEKKGEIYFNINPNMGSSSIMSDEQKNHGMKIELTTVDDFVKENNITKIDFIKADIEGAERDMLRGAKNVLREHAPKLAICTYHLPDDPKVLAEIILEANPAYKIVQLRKKLYACV
jgi:FkbM family methyltransferase